MGRGRKRVRGEERGGGSRGGGGPSDSSSSRPFKDASQLIATPRPSQLPDGRYSSVPMETSASLMMTLPLAITWQKITLQYSIWISVHNEWRTITYTFLKSFPGMILSFLISE